MQRCRNWKKVLIPAFMVWDEPNAGEAGCSRFDYRMNEMKQKWNRNETKNKKCVSNKAFQHEKQ